MILEAKFTCFPLSKTFEKPKKIKDQGIKQVDALKALKPEDNPELKSSEGIFKKKQEVVKLNIK